MDAPWFRLVVGDGVWVAGGLTFGGGGFIACEARGLNVIVVQGQEPGPDDTTDHFHLVGLACLLLEV